MSTERSEMYCHACGKTFAADLDMALNGNHEIHCAFCDHIHYRVVENGRVTGERWQSSMPTYYVTTSTLTISTYSASSSNVYLFDAWTNSTTWTTQ